MPNFTDWSYDNNGNGTCTITGVNSTPINGDNVLVPATIAGLTVVEIIIGGTPLSSTFNNASNLTLEFAKNGFLQTIGNYTFQNCGTFTGDIKIPETVSSLGVEAFSYTTFNGQLSLPSTLGIIYEGVFLGCNNLQTIQGIPPTVTEISAQAFRSCTSLTGVINVPPSVTTIGELAFADCSNLSRIDLTTSVTEIAINSFSNVPLIRYASTQNLSISLTIDQAVAVEFSPSQNQLTFNAPLTTGFPNGAFSATYTGSSTTLFLQFDFPAVFRDWSYVDNDDGTCTITGANSSPYNDDVILVPASIDGLTVTSMNITGTNLSTVFSGKTGLTLQFESGGNLQTIEASTFINCNMLTGSLVLPTTLTSIGNFAFRFCSGFTDNLVIPNSVTSIGDLVFQNCNGFSSTLTLSSNLTNLGYGAFELCSNLKGALTIPGGVSTVSSNSFASCFNFTSLSLAEGISIIDSNAFYDCNKIAGTLTLPSSTTSVGDYAFYNCSSLSQVNIPPTIQNISFAAFDSTTATLQISSPTLNPVNITIPGALTATITPNQPTMTWNAGTTTLSGYGFGTFTVTLDDPLILNFSFPPPCLISPCSITLSDHTKKDVSDLQPGDELLSALTDAPLVIEQVFQNQVDLSLIPVENHPYLIPAHHFAPNIPDKDTLISGYHKILWQSNDKSNHFLGIHTFRVMEKEYLQKEPQSLTYYNIKVQSDKEAIFANSLPVETMSVEKL